MILCPMTENCNGKICDKYRFITSLEGQIGRGNCDQKSVCVKLSPLSNLSLTTLLWDVEFLPDHWFLGVNKSGKLINKIPASEALCIRSCPVLCGVAMSQKKPWMGFWGAFNKVVTDSNMKIMCAVYKHLEYMIAFFLTVPGMFKLPDLPHASLALLASFFSWNVQ